MDETEFDELYGAMAPKLVGQVCALTGNIAEAQDVVQETFIRAWQHRRTLGSHPSVEGWLRTTAYRIAVSRWRRTTAGLRAWRRHGATADVPELTPDNVALVAALRQLPAEQRRAIVLHHLVDLSVDEVAAETGAPSGTVKARLARGRAALAVLLGDDFQSTIPNGVTP